MSDGSVTIDVTLTKDQFNKALKELGYDLDSLGKKNSNVLNTMSKGFTTLGNTFTSIGSTFKKASGVIIGALTGITAGLGTAVSRYDTIKNYPKVMENLGIAGDKAKDSINELSKGIDGLPTALDDAVSGVSRLTAKNGDIDKSTKYFLAMNNAIVAGNAPMEQQKSALEQLTQAYTKGKADMMEWRTMMMAMPGQMTQVAKSYGLTTDELYEKLQKGKISMDSFMDTFVKLNEEGVDGFKSFSEQAKASTDSIGTAITNLGNRIKKGFANILQSLDNALGQTSLGSVAGLINTVSDSINKAMTKIGTAIENSQAVKDFIEKLATGITNLQQKIDNLDEEKIDKFITVFIKLVELAPKLFILGEAFSIFGKLSKGIGTAISVINSVTQGFSALAGALGVTSGYLLVVVGAIALVVGALIYLYNTDENFRNSVQEGWAIVQEIFMQLWEILQPIFQSIMEQLQLLWDKIQPVIEIMKTILPPIIETLIVGIGALVAIIILIVAKAIEYGTMVLNFIVNVVTAIVTFFTDTIPSAIMFVFGKISEFINKVIEVVTHLDYYIGYVIGAIVAFIVNKVIEIKNFIFVTVPNTIDSIIKWFSELPGKIWTWLKNTYDKFVNWGKDMIKKGKESAEKTSESIENGIKELPGKMLEIGKNIVEGIWTGITGAVGWLHDRISGFCQGVIDGFKANLQISSPSRVFKREIGKNIALGIGEGFTDTISEVYQKMENAISSETDKLGKEMTSTGNVSIERNANITSLLNGIIDQETTYTSNTYLDGKVLTTTVNKINARNRFAQGTA